MAVELHERPPRQRAVYEVLLGVVEAEGVLQAGELAAQAAQVARARAGSVLLGGCLQGCRARLMRRMHRLQRPGLKQWV